MRRLIGILALVLGLALVVLGGPSAALASETHPGKFTSGVGYNNGTGAEGLPSGTYDLTPSGSWTLNVGSNGVQVGGNFRVFTKNPTCTAMIQPCPFKLDLAAGTRWIETAPGVFTSTYYTPVVTFAFTLYHPGQGSDVTLVVAITGCPHGWQTWTIQGTEGRS